MSGSAGDAGYDYQAQATAFVSTFVLVGQSLDWFDESRDVPIAISAESQGPGDDLLIETVDGNRIEVQIKHGLRKDARFWHAIDRLATGLVADRSLRGVLFVDGSSSSQIRTSLRQGLLRGGRIDDEKKITSDVRDRFESKGVDAADVFSRLRIIEKNLGLGSDGTDAALAHLAQLIVKRDDLATAWRVLTDEGHKLIRFRGRRNSRSLANLLARHVQLRTDSSSSAVAVEHYLAWIKNTTATFYVPGVGVSLPISEAWIRLRALEDRNNRRPLRSSLERMVKDYHEWEKLADASIVHNAIDIEYLPQFADRLVVIGGPGSGKSTLTRRIVHQLSGRRHVVLSARAKVVAELMRMGKPFEQSILSATTEGSGLSLSALEKEFLHPDFVVLDGLDECDPSRHEVAERLLSWSHGHPNCRIVLTTRPVGHDVGLLPGFQHVELLPLDDRSIEEHSRKLFAAAFDDENESVQRWESFIVDLRRASRQSNRSVRTLAARNPLLLGFLVRLSMDNTDSVQTRADLYEQILLLMEKTSDPAAPSRPTLLPGTARFALDSIGWNLTHSPMLSVDEILERTEESLTHKGSVLAPATTAYESIQFWLGSRTLEKLTAGHLEAIVFVHPALGEFAAARYATRLGFSEFSEWIRQVRRQPAWHQTILLAAGLDREDRVVSTLIELDDHLDACATESKTAASALVDSPSVSNETCQKVVAALLKRLTSEIPLVCVESAIVLIPIAAFAADLIGRMATDLRGHEFEWTRLSAMALQLASNSPAVDVDEFEEWFRTFQLYQMSPFGRFSFVGSAAMPNEAVELQHYIVEAGLRQLIAARPVEHVSTLLRDENVLNRLSWNMRETIVSELRAGGLNDLARELSDGWNDRSDDLEGMLRSRQMETGFLLDCMEAACEIQHVGEPETQGRSFPLPAAVLKAMRTGEAPASEFVSFRRRIGFAAVVEVMKGAIAVLDMDAQALAVEIARARKLIAEDGRQYFSMFPEINVDAQWERASNLELDPDQLLEALRYPHKAIGYTATMLIAAGACGTTTESLVNRALTDGSPDTLHYAAYLAQDAFGDRFVDVLWQRLRREISSGCHHLVQLLIRSAPAERREELLRDAANWLCYPASRFAAAVAEALLELRPPLEKEYEPQLRQSLEYWTGAISWCDDHHKQGSRESCPECNIVLPSVKACVLRLLIKLGATSEGELISLLDDEQREVSKIAKEELISKAACDPALTQLLVERLARRALPLTMLEDLAALPDTILKTVEDRFVRLFTSTETTIRVAALQQLSGRWTSRETAESLARAALSDIDPAVRTQAVRSLRHLHAVVG